MSVVQVVEEEGGHVDGGVDISIPRFSMGAAIVVGTLQSSMVAMLARGLRRLNGDLGKRFSMICGLEWRQFVVTGATQFAGSEFVDVCYFDTNKAFQSASNSSIGGRSIAAHAWIEFGCAIGNNDIRPTSPKGVNIAFASFWIDAITQDTCNNMRQSRLTTTKSAESPRLDTRRAREVHCVLKVREHITDQFHKMHTDCSSSRGNLSKHLTNGFVATTSILQTLVFQVPMSN